MNEACESIKKKIDSVEALLSNKFASLAGQLSNLSSKLSYGTQDLSLKWLEKTNQSPSLSAESMASMTAYTVSEEKEKEKQKSNLTVHNYPEPTSADSQARKKEDIENISTLLNQFCQCTCHNHQCHSPWKTIRMTQTYQDYGVNH